MFLSLDRMAVETRHDPVLSRITENRKKKMKKIIPGRKKPYKEIRYKFNNRTWSDL